MSTPPVVIGEDAPLEEVARVMLEHRIGCIPVVGPRGEVVGIITDTDFVGKERFLAFSAERVPEIFGEPASADEIELSSRRAQRKTAGAVMSSPVLTVTETAPVKEVAEMLLEHRVSHLPVVRADRTPVGVVSRLDLLKLLVQPGER